MDFSESQADRHAAALSRAAGAIRAADALLFTAGAGMGVDSGLPDFRGPEGFWKAYPPYRALGLQFEDLACPDTFLSDPHLAWGFYGHRLNLYRATRPHTGYSIFHRWALSKSGGFFAFTSNVDGHFQSAGFPVDRVAECHGSIHFLQCVDGCSNKIWPADDISVRVDEQTMRAADPLPLCLGCGRLARPNILMFGDSSWVPNRTVAQRRTYNEWLKRLGTASTRVTVLECGAGNAIPTVRIESQRVAEQLGAAFIRINPRHATAPNWAISVPLPALDALQKIDRLVSAR